METARGFDKIARVITIADRPRSYVVESDGRQYERNRKHLLAVEERLPEPTLEPGAPLQERENEETEQSVPKTQTSKALQKHVAKPQTSDVTAPMPWKSLRQSPHVLAG